MNLHIANADDLISILDRVLGKSIVIEAGTYSSLREFGLAVGDKLVPMATKIYVASSAIYNGYGEAGTWREDLELDDLFPFWRRELWSK